jgi:hypothetical protein
VDLPVLHRAKVAPGSRSSLLDGYATSS